VRTPRRHFEITLFIATRKHCRSHNVSVIAQASNDDHFNVTLLRFNKNQQDILVSEPSTNNII